jgi:quercetin dioxygenase-like cupin family protein
VRLIAFDPERLRAIDHHGSSGFELAPLTRIPDGPGHVVLVRLAPGGRIGRHPTAGAQLLAVVSGSGTVSGGDGVDRPIAAGTAAAWEAGEQHETRTDEGLVAVVVEAAELEP